MRHNQDQCPTLRDEVIREMIAPPPDPAAMAALGEKFRKQYTEQIETRLADWAVFRKMEPTCYEPISWFGRQVPRIEKWLWVRN